MVFLVIILPLICAIISGGIAYFISKRFYKLLLKRNIRHPRFWQFMLWLLVFAALTSIACFIIAMNLTLGR